LATRVKNINAKYKTKKEWMTEGLLCAARNKQKIAMKVKKNILIIQNYLSIVLTIKIILQTF